MEDENANNYLSMMHKIIKRANPKYMSFVSREYMKYSFNSPVISETILDMIRTEVKKNEQSPYAIFIDDDGSVNLEAMNDISKITNLPQFISQVQNLAKYDIDFSEMSADDLIKEADQIAAELEKEIDSELAKTDISSEDASSVGHRAETGIAKLGLFASIGIGVAAAISKIREKILELKSKAGKTETPEEERDTQQSAESPILPNIENSDSFENVCPKVEVNEKAVLKKMKSTEIGNDKSLNTDTYGDGDPDGDDLDM